MLCKYAFTFSNISAVFFPNMLLKLLNLIDFAIDVSVKDIKSSKYDLMPSLWAAEARAMAILQCPNPILIVPIINEFFGFISSYFSFLPVSESVMAFSSSRLTSVHTLKSL